MKNRDRNVRFYFLLLLISAVPLFAFGLSNHGVWSADEPRVAEIGREMALSGNWAVPTLNQRPFLEQPPLYYASIAAVFRVFGGPSVKTVRIPSAIFSFCGVLSLFFLGTMLFGPRTGFLSAFIMATCAEYVHVAHWVIVDNALTWFVILSLTFFFGAYLSRNRRTRFFLYALCYVCCTLAFYSKGFIGVAIPGVAVLTFLVFGKNLREIFKMHLWLGIGIFLVLTLPWFIELWHQGGWEYLEVFLVHNHLERFASESTNHAQPFYFYLIQLPGAFLPWTLLLIPVFYWSFRKTTYPDDKSRQAVLFAKCWFIAGFVLLSLASAKRVLYLMPILAPISLLTATYIEAGLKRTDFRKFETFFILAFGVAVFLVSLATIPLYFYASKKYAFGVPLAETAEVILFALVATALSLAALWGYTRDKVKFWALSGASVLLLLLLGLLTAMPLLDRYKSFVPFCDAVKAATNGTATLYAYRPDETLRGVVPFYTGQFLREIETLPALEEAIQKEQVTFVVIRDRRQQLENELLSSGKLSVMARYDMETDASHSMVLFRVAGAATPDQTNVRSK